MVEQLKVVGRMRLETLFDSANSAALHEHKPGSARTPFCISRLDVSLFYFVCE